MACLVETTDDTVSSTDSKDNVQDQNERPPTRRGRSVNEDDKYQNTTTKSEENEETFMNTTSMQCLKNKLKTISESSESTSTPVCNPCEDIDECNVQKVPSMIREYSQGFQLKLPPSNRCCETNKLCIQRLPSINIPQALNQEKTLDLTINPDGTSRDNLKIKESHILYEEVCSKKKSLERISGPLQKIDSRPKSVDSAAQLDSSSVDNKTEDNDEKYEEKLESQIEFDSYLDSLAKYNEQETISGTDKKETQYIEQSIPNKVTEQKFKSDAVLEMHDENKASIRKYSFISNDVQRPLKVPDFVFVDQPSATDFSTSMDEIRRSFQVKNNTSHEPDPLQRESEIKLCQVDPNVYQSYINPNPTFYSSNDISDTTNRANEDSVDVKPTSSHLLTRQPVELVTPILNLFQNGFLKCQSTQCDLSGHETHPTFETQSQCSENICNHTILNEEYCKGFQSPPSVEENKNRTCSTKSDTSFQLIIKITDEEQSRSIDETFNLQKDIENLKNVNETVVTKDSPSSSRKGIETRNVTTSVCLNDNSVQKKTQKGRSDHSKQGEKPKKYPVETNLLANENRNPTDDLFQTFKYVKVEDLDKYRRSSGIPDRRRRRRRIPSESSTLESLSDGQVTCACSGISIGEIHNCPHRTKIKSKGQPNRIHKFPKAFTLNDPNVTVEQHNRYFNSWVTYYIRKKNEGYVDSPSTSGSCK